MSDRLRPRPRIRTIAVVVAALLGIPLLAGAAAAAKDERPDVGERREGIRSYFASSVGKTDSGMVITWYWSMGALFRSDTNIAGHPITTIVNGDNYYIIDELAALGVVIKRDPEVVAEDSERMRPFAVEYQEIMARGGEKIREEDLGGNKVDVVRITTDKLRRTVWVTQDVERLPLRIEAVSKRTGETGRLDYMTWQPNLPMAASFFEPPPGIELRRFDSYQQYVLELQKGPIPPAPPLFNNLLRRK